MRRDALCLGRVPATWPRFNNIHPDFHYVRHLFGADITYAHLYDCNEVVICYISTI